MKNLSKILLFSLFFSFTCLSAEEDMKTWFGDPDLQGVWTNASLTTLERPDQYESLLVTEEEANRAATVSAEFTDAIANPY